MLNRVEFQAIQSPQFLQQQAQGFQGITSDFFGQPSQADKMKDMRLSKSLGIDTAGMDREDIKANILSQLTGKSVEEMKTFYTSCSEADMKKDMQQMQTLGLEASSQPNWLDARSENKASIVNALIQANGTQATNEEGQTEQTQETSETQQAQQTQQGGNKASSSSMDSLISFLQSLGLSPSGSKEGDYAAVMSKLNSMEAEAKASGNGSGNGDDTKLQSISAMRQSFMAIYASL